jgi:hypothetical protein
VLAILEPFLQKKTQPSLADLKAAIEEVDRTEKQTAARVDQLRSDYKRGLVNGATNLELDTIDDNLKTASRDLERIYYAREELSELIVKLSKPIALVNATRSSMRL